MSASKKGEYLNLPNYLTLGRIVLIPVVMILLHEISLSQSEMRTLLMGVLAAGVFIIAGVSDLVDGYYARKFKINSVFGKYFDPLADKLMILTVMIMLIPLGRIPAWIVVLFLGREITITALRGVSAAEGMAFSADQWGKKKTVLQNIALVALMIHYPMFGVNLQKFGWWVLVMALIVAIGSGINYVYQFTRAILKRY
jgi:CDP-diacylglycerol--glycerol-3-phosphate 3-phosphatidyltransferase